MEPTGAGPAEAALLCACARRRAQDSALPPTTSLNVDWDAVLRAADAHAVTELLTAPLKSRATHVPPQVMAHLQQRSVEVTSQNLGRITELIDVLTLLTTAGIRALTFKGPTLAAAYGHIGRRRSSDLDIFVARRDVSRVRPLLLSRGYRIPPQARWRGDSLLYGLLPAAGRSDTLLPSHPKQSMIDVHVAFAAWRYDIRIDTRSLFDRAVAVEVAGRALPTLCPDDLLLVLAIHGMTHAWGNLRLISDIDAVAEWVTDWNVVITRAEAAGMRRILCVALLLSHRVLGTDLPPAVLARASADAGAVQLTDDAVARLFDAHAGPNPRQRAWLRSFLDTPRRRATFVVRDTIHEWFLLWPWNTAFTRRTTTRD